MAGRFRETRITGLLMLAVGLSGCAAGVRTRYVAPVLPVASGWEAPAVSPPATVSADPWWTRFGDPALDRLVADVLAASPDLAAAGFRLRQAQESARLAARRLSPTLSANVSDTATNRLDQGLTLTQNAATAIGVSWDLDLFGRLGAQRDAASWEAAATAQDLAATRLSLIGTTVILWWQLGYANQRLTLARQSLANADRTLRLVRVQYAAGAVSGIALRDAEQATAAQRATLPPIEQDGSEARNALAALLGRQGYGGAERPSPGDGPLPAIASGLPASLLARRPDLAAAELRLRATLARSDADRAALYPSLTLTGGVGTASTALLTILGNPVASLGALFSSAALNPDRIALGSRVARLDYDIAAAAFRQTFYDALRDTANALSARTRLIERTGGLRASYDAARDAEMLYERRYRQGAIPLRDWLDAQERRRGAELTLAANSFDTLVAHARVEMALGSGR